MYYIIEHPSRGVYTGIARIRGTLGRSPADRAPQFSNYRTRVEAAWMVNHAHAMRTLARIREYGVRGCYILKAVERIRGGVLLTVFTKDNENTLGD